MGIGSNVAKLSVIIIIKFYISINIKKCLPIHQNNHNYSLRILKVSLIELGDIKDIAYHHDNGVESTI